MKHGFFVVAISAAAIIASTHAQAPQPQPPPKPAPTADPYANNPNAGAAKFPLAAPAGRDSGAKTSAPADAVNKGAFDPSTWKYGPAFDAPAGSKVWNPAKLKLQQGGKVTGRSEEHTSELQSQSNLV